MLTRTVRALLAEQYTDMLAQDYRLRNVLLSSYHHDFGSLLQFDQRIQSYLDGMLLLKEETAAYLRGQLQELLSPGELFSVAAFAANANDEFLLSGCLGLAQGMPRLLPSLLAVTSWMPEASALWSLITSHPACRVFASVMREGITSPAVFTQQEVISLIENGQCVDFLLWFLRKGNSPLFVPAIKQVFSSGQDALILQGCRAILCQRPSADEYIEIVREQLLLLAHSKKTDIRTQAVRYLLVCSLCDPRALISALSEQGDTRLLIQAMGWSGLAEYIPSLAAFFDEQRYARLSMLSVVAITGSLPERDGWQMKKEDEMLPAPDPDLADIPEIDPEQGVSWPDRTAFNHWWRANQGNLGSESPYLCGQPVTSEGLATVIANGYLNLRPLAIMRSGMFPEQSSLPAASQCQIFNMSFKNK
ncbi:hypothetical protein J5L86_002101 [Salmonella enterica]|nr:hypothetical protein [Salmonella enterica subsp. salamae]EHI7817670.1 hypothetical protein [Salmonella enterica]EHJ0755056.1 hypothetical protein [Salmonella enterica]HAU3141614.1 hypothetical protein [Salmonella enterica]HAU3146404.1 hypothetical protein [Salmonella enterica subsp. salamae]